MDRLKEIKYEKYVLCQKLKQLKKELKKLQEEENMINGYKTIEREQQKSLNKKKR